MERVEILSYREVVAWVVLLGAIYTTTGHNHVLFMTITEVIGVIVACGIFMMSWNARGLTENDFILFLGIAYLSVAILDMTHILTFEELGMFLLHDANPSIQLWIAARYVQAISLIVAPLFLRRKLNERVAVAGYLLLTALFMASILLWGMFPDCFVEGVGLTPFKVYSEYAISFILLGAVLMLRANGHLLEPDMFHLLTASILLFLLSGVSATLFRDIHGFFNMLGHFFKVISFYLIYKAVIATSLMKPYDVLFRELARSGERFKMLFDRASDGVTLVRITEEGLPGTFIEVNDAACETLGYSREELLTLSPSDISAPGRGEDDATIVKRLGEEGHVIFERTQVAKDGRTIPVEISSHLFELDDRPAVLSVARDITERKKAEVEREKYRHELESMVDKRTGELNATVNRLEGEVEERKRAEEKLEGSLEEKTVLLKEVHHRVKNNMQVISSLLNLQSEQIMDEGVRAKFRESQDRVKSMALIHESLYRSANLARIDFGGYVEQLVNSLHRTYGATAAGVDLKVDVADIPMSVDVAIPCGLIINELVTNAFKHAFHDGRKGEVCISLSQGDGGMLLLMVSNNGIPFPEDIDIRNTESLGLQLVNTLTGQLRGTIELDESHGTAFRITFPRKGNGDNSTKGA